MSRKAFSDGLKKALLDAGAVDLMQGTVLAHHEAMEPGGGGRLPKLYAVGPSYATCKHGNCSLHALFAVRLWWLMLHKSYVSYRSEQLAETWLRTG